MINAKLQDHWTSGSEEYFKGFTIYGCGCHLGHMTWTIYNFPPSPGSTYLALIGQEDL